MWIVDNRTHGAACINGDRWSLKLYLRDMHNLVADLSTHALISAGYPPLLGHILNGKEYGPLLKSPDVDKHREKWRTLMRELAVCARIDSVISTRLHTQWHVSHHFIRELVDDDELIMEMLWTWLPRYSGPAILLYRGENIDRLECGKIGTAWTDKEKTARMFASGWNAEGKGGVILETIAPADAIIAAPSNHSANWLGEREFTVDWRRLTEIKRKLFFPPRG